MRRKRQLPERYRPLAALCEAANLISAGQFVIVERAATQLEQTFALSPDASRIATLMAANVLRRVAPEFAKHPAALAELSKLTGNPSLPQARDGGLQLFHTLAETRAVLREVALLSARVAIGSVEQPSGLIVGLPESTPPKLGVVDGKIRLITRPAWLRLLPPLLVDDGGLEVGRLQICERCERLYVAARRDQLGCSATCGDTLYMRRYRNPDYRKRNEPGSKRRIARETYQLLKRGKK
jgi:hypothetical protein